ncbi:unnamed protein product [Nesidiocoris tenuis]|uniref:Retrotransposon gag domain-containing protein n=1 Tax=Nesidiocoris tenuis TaxID=355587 RepID=A0A6H5GEA8_9HEMI|nr:unnamed protein product [Nesidiocoris tenuis]
MEELEGRCTPLKAARGFDTEQSRMDVTTATSGKPEEVFKTLDEVIEAFTDYFTPKKNVLHDRHKFNKLSLQPGQPIVEFVTALKVAASSCEYLERNALIRDRLIAEIQDPGLLSRLLDEGDRLDLDRAVQICKLHELRRIEIKDFRQESEPELDAIRQKGTSRKYRQTPASKKINIKQNRLYLCKKMQNRTFLWQLSSIWSDLYKMQ